MARFMTENAACKHTRAQGALQQQTDKLRLRDLADGDTTTNHALIFQHTPEPVNLLHGEIS
jgi:hypothetical protein